MEVKECKAASATPNEIKPKEPSRSEQCASLTLKVSWTASSRAKFKYRSKITTAPPSDSSVIVGVEADTAQYGLGGGL